MTYVEAIDIVRKEIIELPQKAMLALKIRKHFKTGEWVACTPKNGSQKYAGKVVGFYQNGDILVEHLPIDTKRVTQTRLTQEEVFHV